MCKKYKRIKPEYILGMSTINAAPIIAIINNIQITEYNIWINLSILCFGLGVAATVLVGLKALDLFQDNSKIESNDNNEQECEKEYITEMNVLIFLSIFMPIPGLLFFLIGVNKWENVALPLNILVIILLIIISYFVYKLKFWRETFKKTIYTKNDFRGWSNLYYNRVNYFFMYT